MTHYQSNDSFAAYYQRKLILVNWPVYYGQTKPTSETVMIFCKLDAGFETGLTKLLDWLIYRINLHSGWPHHQQTWNPKSALDDLYSITIWSLLGEDYRWPRDFQPLYANILCNHYFRGVKFLSLRKSLFNIHCFRGWRIDIFYHNTCCSLFLVLQDLNSWACICITVTTKITSQRYWC